MSEPPNNEPRPHEAKSSVLQFFDDAFEMTGYLRVAVWIFPLFVIIVGVSVFLVGLVFTRIHPVWIAILILFLSGTLVTAASLVFYRQRAELRHEKIVDYLYALRADMPRSHVEPSKSKDITQVIKKSDDKYSRAGLAEINERLHELYVKLGPPGERL